MTVGGRGHLYITGRNGRHIMKRYMSKRSAICKKTRKSSSIVTLIALTPQRTHLFFVDKNAWGCSVCF